jgi:4-carboxymuconolactone decarboxylase
MVASMNVGHPGQLDEKTRALVCLGALVATTAGGCSYHDLVASALRAGATPEEIVDVLICVAPTVGLADLVAATVPLARELGVDLDEAFEQLDRPAG